MEEQKNNALDSQEQKTNAQKILAAMKKRKKLYYASCGFYCWLSCYNGIT